MNIALFDLDNTLLGGDSDYLWGQFLIEKGLVDQCAHEKKNKLFYEQYQEGTLDIYEFIEFQLEVLAAHDIKQLHAWRTEYVENKIKPILLKKAMDLVNEHRSRSHQLVIITATNRFITEPIAELFGVNHLLATEPELLNGQYTGKCVGIPCFQDGKIKRYEQWMKEQGVTCLSSWFYSDSHNDIPLLEYVDTPLAVDPDKKLANYARAHNWPIMSLRDAS